MKLIDKIANIRFLIQETVVDTEPIKNDIDKGFIEGLKFVDKELKYLEKGVK